MNMYDVANRFAHLNHLENIEITTDITTHATIKRNQQSIQLFFQTDTDAIISAFLEKIFSIDDPNLLIAVQEVCTIFDISCNDIETKVILTATLSVCAGNRPESMCTRLYFDTMELGYEYTAIIEKEIANLKSPVRLNDVIQLFDIDPKKDAWVETNHQVFLR